jgi:uncharacterized RDD family membrane protein YckC
MSDDPRTIEDYAQAFERCLVGPAREKARSRDELVAHLYDAAEAGDLAEVLQRLGSPRSAAALFTWARTAPLASIYRRLRAALIDLLPLIGVTIALTVRQVETGHHVLLAFPPSVSVSLPGEGILQAVAVPLALVWSILVLGILESRTGSTPGKWLFGLTVVSETGLRAPLGACVVRRLSLLAGPFAWLDWLPQLWGERRRFLDRVAGTKVVAQRGRGEPRPVPGRRLPFSKGGRGFKRAGNRPA